MAALRLGFPAGSSPYPAEMGAREPSRLLTAAQAVAGGLVTDAAFPDRNLWPAAMLGVALLLLALRRDDARWGAVVGFLWGIAFFLPHIAWLNTSVGVVPWVALVTAEAAFVAALGAGWVWSRRSRFLADHPYRQVAVFAAAWVTVEQARSAWPFGGFPWGRLAFSQTESPLLPLASVGGAPLVSALVAACGALLALTWGAVRRGSLLRAAIPVALAGVLVVAGSALVLPGSAPAPAGSTAPGDDAAEAGTLRIGAVQGNVAEPGLDAFARQLEVLRNHVEGTGELAAAGAPGDLDLVLWPENAADVDPRSDVRARALVDEAAEAAGAPILVGTLRYDDRGRYNDSVLWVAGEGAVAVYTKQHPAPFAEYIPIRDVARLFSDKVDLVRTDMLPGTGVGVVPVSVDRLDRTVPVASVICFEVAYDGLVRDAVLAGGEIVVVQTNNASFGLTPESTQQLAMTRFRAVEHGRVAVQVSTVGVSGVIGPDGAVLESTELFTAAQLRHTVPLRTSLTVADRLGVWPPWLAAIVAGAALVLGVTAGVRRTRLPAEPSPDEDPTLVRSTP